MSRPTVLTVDDDPQVSAALARDLKRRYGAEYRVLAATSAAQARELLETTDLTVDHVAERCGLGSPANLRQHFHRALGTSPNHYRRTFAAG